MAHSKEAHGQMAGKHSKNGHIAHMGDDHWAKNPGDVMVSDMRYTKGEMENPEHLKKSVNDLSGYLKKNEMSYP